MAGLDWSVYDRWVRARPAVSLHAELVVVVRDRDSEARFGAASWDRAVLARLVGNLSRAGAAAIGLDVPLGQPSPPGRGGAASDALLRQATALAGAVVYPVSTDTSSTSLRVNSSGRAVGVGHTAAPPDADGVVRRVPLLIRVDGTAVPAFALALAATASRETPSEGSDLVLGFTRVSPEAMLISYATAEGEPGPPAVPFSEIWKLVERGDGDTLQRLVADKIVLVLAEPAQGRNLTPLGTMPDMVVQTHLANTILTGDWMRETPREWKIVVALLLACVAGWLLPALGWWKGLVAGGALALSYGTAVALALPLAHLVLPVWLPLAAVVLAAAGGLLWNQFTSADRIRGLERQIDRVGKELAEAREALVRRESAVEALEEDVEAARATAARSAGAELELARAAESLRAELIQAREHEGRARERLGALERELRGLRAADAGDDALLDAEQERLRRGCERMGIITRDPTVLAVSRDLEKAARSSLPVLLLGEPGTGKELFARAAHRLSRRAEMPFIAVNMAAVSPDLFESELFGHVKGSFTGALADRKGYFELADRGTIFLDEVGDLRLEHQSKLLRVLQEGTFYRVGASRATTVDVRVVAASNRDLERGAVEGWFREDLYFRLKGVVLRLPPLRRRPDDLPLLAARFVGAAAAEAGREGLTLSEEALQALRSHPWSGNVRELQHCLRQAVALAEGPVITRDDLRLTSPRPTAPGGVQVDVDPGSDGAVLACLRRHGFDMQAAARALGWDRSTVTQRLKGMGFRALIDAGGDRAKAALVLAGDASLVATVETKLREYHEHLLRAIRGFDSPEAAVLACRRRFKNLPERHFRSLEALVRQAFERRS